MTTRQLYKDNYLNIISDILKKDVTEFEPHFLKGVLTERMSVNEILSLYDYCLLLQKSKKEVHALESSLLVSYSEFFRNPMVANFIYQHLLPHLFSRKNKEVRIWSAACSAGQESYSLAILINDFIKISQRKVDFRIFATDIDVKQVANAGKGIYNQSSLNNVTTKQMKDWFIARDQYYEVKPELKKNISFSAFDLLSEIHLCPPESIFGDFDIIFCSNVLFYYSAEARIGILNKLHKVLNSNGFLITSETETDVVSDNFRKLYPFLPVFVKRENNITI